MSYPCKLRLVGSQEFDPEVRGGEGCVLGEGVVHCDGVMVCLCDNVDV